MSPLLGATATADELPPGGTFVDDDGSVHQGYIEAIADAGVTYGCDDDRYCPRRDVTRGQMAAFISRALSLGSTSTDYFTDDDSSVFEGDINALAEAGITVGCGDGTTFCPDRAVTRAEMAAFLRRAGDMPAATGDRFSDDDDSVFEGDIQALAQAGVTSGCNPPENTRFCPDATTTRGQMASFLGRFLDLEPMNPPASDPSSSSVSDSVRRWFPDLYGEAMSVADCESNHNPKAVNSRGGYHGLFQIGERYHRSAFERVTGQSWSDGIYVAYYNAQYARYLYDQSDSWRAWTCKP